MAARFPVFHLFWQVTRLSYQLKDRGNGLHLPPGRFPTGFAQSRARFTLTAIGAGKVRAYYPGILPLPAVSLRSAFLAVS